MKINYTITCIEGASNKVTSVGYNTNGSKITINKSLKLDFINNLKPRDTINTIIHPKVEVVNGSNGKYLRTDGNKNKNDDLLDLQPCK